MTATALMEIKEAEIRKHYPQTYQLLAGFDYAPRIGRASEAPAAGSGRSPGIPGRRGFRTTPPGRASQATESGHEMCAMSTQRSPFSPRGPAVAGPPGAPAGRRLSAVPGAVR